MREYLENYKEENDSCNGSDEGDSDDEDSLYGDYFSSIRTDTGLEVGNRVTWPNIEKELILSTCLPEAAIAPIFNGTQWAGTRLWRAAIVATQFLLHISSDEQKTGAKNSSGTETALILDAETTVLELGCGLGVPGMILHVARNCPVVLTDMDDLVDQLHQNLEKNFENSSNIQVQSLDWSESGVQELLQKVSINKKDISANGFDVVFNCDCIFEPLYGTSWKQLLICQEQFLRIRPDAYMLTSCERRRLDGVEKYLEAAELSPDISRVERIDIPFDHPSEIELYRLYGKTPDTSS